MLSKLFTVEPLGCCIAEFVLCSNLLSGEAQPECAHCECPLTVKHFLLECVAFRRNCYTASTVK